MRHFSADSCDVEEKDMSAPCKGCKNRTVGCHANCEWYIRFREEHEQLQDTIRKEKARRSARQMTMTDKQFMNAGQSFNKVFKQHKK